MKSTAFLVLASKKFEKWVGVQRESLKRWAPEADYIVVTEEELRRDPNATQYEEILPLLYSNRPKQVLKYLKKYKQVIHVGADVYFTGPILDVVNNDFYKAVGTPHITEPLPEDGRAPSTIGVHRVGQLNSDFTVWNDKYEVENFLKWQASQMERFECCANLALGLFYDQVWLSYAPYFIPDFHILRHPGVNVAHFNLPQRAIYKSNDRWTCNGAPLYCFQFSGYEPETAPFTLSKYNQRPEIQTAAVYNLMQEFYNAYCAQDEKVAATGIESYSCPETTTQEITIGEQGQKVKGQ